MAGFASASSLAAFRADPYSVRLAPTDALYVESADYACVVTLSAEDARLLAERYAVQRPAVAAPSRTDAKNSAPAAAAPGAASAGSEVRNPPAKVTRTGAMIPTLDANPETRALILRLLRERYRAALENRCGPLP